MAENREVVTAAPRSFAVFLGQVADGDLEREAAKLLYDLVGKLRAEAEVAGGAAKGSISMKLNIKVDIKGQITVGYTLDSKEPLPVRPDSTMWLNEQGQVVFEHPRQGNLYPREVGGNHGARELDHVAASTREI